MKLKERPLAWWSGKKFTYWCRADQNDQRKINYTVMHRSIGKGLRVFHFTSDDCVDWEKMYWLQTGRIEKLELKRDEWFVVVNAGILPYKQPKKNS